VLVRGGFVPAHDHGHIGIDLGDFFEPAEEFGVVVRLGINHHPAVGVHVDHDLVVFAAERLAFVGGGQADVDFRFEAGEFPGDDEKGEEQDEHVDERGDLDAQGFVRGAFAEFHSGRGKGEAMRDEGGGMKD
jgi:hypothetical protein